MELTRSRYLSETEVHTLRRACQDWALADGVKGRAGGVKTWMVVDLALTTGLRVSELTALTVADLDFIGKAIAVQRRKKKQPVKEFIPLPSKLADHLKGYLNGRTAGPIVLGKRGPLTRRGWQQAWLQACQRAGVRPLSIHKARHTAATILYRHTHDLRLVQKQLGHSSPAVTQVYADVTFEDMGKAGESMFKD